MHVRVLALQMGTARHTHLFVCQGIAPHISLQCHARVVQPQQSLTSRHHIPFLLPSAPRRFKKADNEEQLCGLTH